MIDIAAPKLHPAIDEMEDMTEPDSKDLEVKDGDQAVSLVNVFEPEASPELGRQAPETTKKGRNSMYSICSLVNVHFQELLEEHELTYGEPFLEALNFVFSDPLYNA